MNVLFHKDILYVNVKISCDEEDFINNVRIIAKSDITTLTLCVESYQYNWLNTIIRPMRINITIRVTPVYNLLLTDCKLVDIQRGDINNHVTFSIGGKTIEASASTDKNPKIET